MLREWPAFEALAKSFAEGDPCLRIAGLTGAARALAVAELLQTHPRPALVVVGGVADAHRWTQDLRLFGTAALEFPSPEPRLWRGGHHREADAERAMIARRLTVADPVTVVATPAALTAPLLSRAEFAERTLRLTTGDRLDRELLLEALERCCYERVETVVAVGQWSVRGGIVDVFSPSQASPARLEFSGDDVESIRLFDPTSQRSVVSLDELLVLPLAPEDGGSILDGYGERGLWHTTETDTWPSYSSGFWPQLTVSWSSGRFIARGHVRHDRAARALRNEPGGCQTNRTGVKQVEIVTRADIVDVVGLPAVAEDGLGRYAQWCRAEWGVPLECRVRFITYPSSFGPANGVRLTCAEWWPLVGWCGHMHVPENVHGDPGQLNPAAILRLAPPPPPPPPPEPPPPPTGWRVLSPD